MTEDYICVSIYDRQVQGWQPEDYYRFLVLAIETTRTLLLKFPDREPDSGYGELAHISLMSQHMDT